MEVGRMDCSTQWPVLEGQHPLQTSWSFWYDKKLSKKTSTVEFREKLHKLGNAYFSVKSSTVAVFNSIFNPIVARFI